MSNSTIIEASALTKYYKRKKEPALDSLSLKIRGGGIFTLLGRNGAGKTTFLRIAATQLLPTSGSLSVFGLDALKHPKEVRRRIAITPQEAKPLWSLNPFDHIVLALMMRGKSRPEAMKKAERVMQTLELTEFGRVHSEELSGGLRQRILIAMTIACDVDLMFLDEPTIGLDPVGRRRVWNELIRLKEEEGRTIVLTTHYMDEAEALSDELAIIDRGRVMTSGTAAEVRSRHLSSKIRVDVARGFSAVELEPYGKVTKAGNLLRLFVTESTAEELSKEALRRKAVMTISPITLDDAFIEVVGADIEEEGDDEGTAETGDDGSIGAYSR
jgi:ABC-2 type transport system ATP-binding protein